MVQAIASGGITSSDGEIIMNILDVRRKAVETVELSQRVEQLESAARNFQGKAGESLMSAQLRKRIERMDRIVDALQPDAGKGFDLGRRLVEARAGFPDSTP